MPTEIPIRFTMGSLTLGTKQTRQEFADEIASKLQAEWNGSVAFVNGGPEPTSNQGPWLRNGNEWRFWNPATASYSLGVFPVGMITMTGNPTVNALNGWLLCDGSQVGVDSYPALFSVIGYSFNIASDNSAGVPINPTVFRIPDMRSRFPVGAGDGGSGLTNRTIGSRGGNELVALTQATGFFDHFHPFGSSGGDDAILSRRSFTLGSDPGRLVSGNAGGGTFPLDTFTISLGTLDGIASGTVDGHDNIPPYQAVNFMIKY